MKERLLYFLSKIGFCVGGVLFIGVCAFAQVTPTISSFSPGSGSISTSVTITGSNFNATANLNAVFFGATQATVTGATSTSLTVTVPYGANYQYISVTNLGTNLTAYSARPFVVTYATGVLNDFAPANNIIVGTGASILSASIGDMDKDGLTDLIISDSGVNLVKVYRNTSVGNNLSFSLSTSLSTASVPRNIAVGDLNGDGYLDIVVGTSGASNIYVYRNTIASVGSLSFTTSLTLATNSQPVSVGIGDLDGDGLPEIIAPNYQSSNVSLFRNVSVGNTLAFNPKVDIGVGTNPHYVTIGDIDGDGKPDLAIPNGVSNNVSILRNLSSIGNLAFTSALTPSTGSEPLSVVLGDLDLDGKPDLAVSNHGSNSGNTISVFRNTSVPGTISLQTVQTFTSGTGPRTIAIGDLNGDGYPDLATTNEVSNTVSVFRNSSVSGTINFMAKSDYSVGSTPYLLSIGDLNNDGLLDIVESNGATNTVSILRNIHLAPVVISSFSPTSGPISTTVTITGQNFNSIANQNIVFFGATKAVVTGATNTSLTVTVPYGANYQYISVTNLVYNTTGYSAKPFVVTYPTPGNNFNVFAPSIDYLTGGMRTFGHVVKDFNADGKPDVVVVNNSSNSLSIYFNTTLPGSTSISFITQTTTLAGTFDPIAMDSGDFDGDGKPDLAFVGYTPKSVYIYRNTSSSSSISFTYIGSLATNTSFNARSIVVGDFDKDGYPDIAVNGINTSNPVYLSVFRNLSFNTGSISFGLNTDFVTGSPAWNNYAIAAGDIDGDGKVDLIDGNDVSLTVLRNISTGPGSINFASGVGTGVVGRSTIAVGDFNGDGKLDISQANGTSTYVLPNNSTSGTISMGLTITLTSLSDTRAVAMGDVNGDGKPDLVTVSNVNGYSVSVFKNTSASASTITFANRDDYSATGSTSDPNSQFVSLADLNADGMLDIILDKENVGVSGWISILRNTMAPVIVSSFNPTSGPISTSVTITGQNFNATANQNVVFFGATRGTVTGATSTSLTVTVPYGANYQYISVTNLETNLTAYSASPFVVTTPNGTNLVDFAPVISLSNGVNDNRPLRVAIKDFDGDGKPDLAVTYASTNNRTVLFLNQSTPGGTLVFSPSANVLLGNNFDAVASADFNGDGKPDLAIVDYNAQTVSVYKNVSTLGNLSFTLQAAMTPSVHPTMLEAGDMNSDGWPDIILGYYDTQNFVTLFRNRSNFNFDNAVSFTVGGTSPEGTAIGDINGDGMPDIVSSNLSNSTISVLVNAATARGALSFNSAVTYTLPNSSSAPHRVAIGDINGDGKLDVVTANYGSSDISIFRNDGAQGVGAAISLTALSLHPSVGTNPNAIAIGDVTGDGIPDLVVGNYSSNTISVLKNTTASTSTITLASRIDYSSGASPFWIELGDLNSDSKLDIAVGHEGNNVFTLLQNVMPALAPVITSFAPASGSISTSVTITGSNFNATANQNVVFFGATQAVVTGATSTSLTVTVPYGANYQYISVTNLAYNTTGYSATPFVVTFPSNGVTDFVTDPVLSSSGALGVALGDLNGDGKPDLVLANYVNPATISVYLNTSSVGGILTFAVSTSLGVGNLNAGYLTVGDLDGDGRLDIVVSTNGAGEQGAGIIAALRNQTSTGSMSLSFSSAQTLAITPTAQNPRRVVIADLDSDGRPDITFSNWVNTGSGSNARQITILRNMSVSGTINFGGGQNIIVGSGAPFWIAVGDLNKDNKPDLVVDNDGDAGLYILQNISTVGSISFSITATLSGSSSGQEEIVLGDFDGDSNLDIAVTNNSSNLISFFRNTFSVTGTISFPSTASITFTSGGGPFGVSLGDVDGDGKLDLAVVNSSSNTLSVLKNGSTGIGSFSFSNRVNYTTGSTPKYLVVGDMNADGKPDIATENNGSGTISLFRNIATVAPPVITSFAPKSGSISTSVTITGQNFNSIAANNIVFFGSTQAVVTGASSTSLTVTVPYGANYQYISVTNLSNQTVPYLASNLTGYSATPFVVTYSPTGDNSFRAKSTLSAGLTPTCVIIFDLNRDSKPDLVVGNSNNTVSIFQNATTSGATATTFGTAISLSGVAGSVSSSVVVGDVDGDGLPDVVLVNSGSGVVSIFRNVSVGGAISFTTQALSFSTGTSPSAIAMADLDGDGRLDLAVANSGSGNVFLFRNQSVSGTMAFASAQTLTVGTTPRSLAVGDFDQDSRIDLAVANVGSNSVQVFRNTSVTGSISLSLSTTLSGLSTPTSLAIGDFNGDGFLDMSVANNLSGNNTVSVFKCVGVVGTISFTSLTVTTGASPLALALADFDGNGYPDIVTANSASNTISVLQTSATNSLSFTTKLDVSGLNSINTGGLAAGDLNGDSMPDIVTTTSGTTNNVGVFLQYARLPQSLTITSAGSIGVGSGLSISVSRSLSPTSSSNTLSYSIVSGGGSATLQAVGGSVTITGVNVGTVTLTVTALGDSVYQSASTSQLILITKSTPTLTITSSALVLVGSSLTPSVTSTAQNGGGGSISFTVANGNGSAVVGSPPTYLVTGITVGQITLTATSLGDTNYYSATASQVVTIYKAPGAVSNGMKLWLRADNGVSPTTGNVSRWDDQSQSITNPANQATPVGGASSDIVVTPTDLNFNPTLTFSGANSKELQGVGDFSFVTGSSNTIIAVAKNLSTQFSAVFSSIGSSNAGPGLSTGITNLSSYALDGNGCVASPTAGSTAPSVVTGQYTSLSSGNTYLNGVGSTVTVGCSISQTATNFEIGGRTLGGGSYLARIFTGNIGEVIYYNRGISSQELLQVQSYLAIKYGIHLDPTAVSNYLASDGSTIWSNTTNAGYTNTVMGIGRDDNSGLYQRQSKSAIGGDMLTFGIGSLTSSNVANVGTFSSDKSFLLVGNNGSLTSTINATDIPLTPTTSTSMRMRLGRVWEAQKTGGVGSMELQFDLTGSFSSTVPYQVSELCLLIDKNQNGSFTDESIGSGGLLTGALTTATSNVYKFSGVSLNSGDRFTVGLVKRGQTLVFNNPPSTLSTNSTATVTATLSPSVGSTQQVVYSVFSGGGSATVNSSTGQLTGTGSGPITLTATAGADSNYNGAVSSILISIGSSTPVLSLTPTLGSGSLTVGQSMMITALSNPPVSTTGQTISYSIIGGTGSATLNPNTGQLTGTGAGSITFTATSAANSNYGTAITSTVIVIGKSTPTLVFSPLPSGMVVGLTQTVSATSTTSLVDSGGGISYTLGSGTGSGTINSSTGLVTAMGSGTLTIIATLLGNTNYNQSVTSTVIVIGKSTPTLVFNPLPSGMVVGLTQTVSATSTTSLVDNGGGISYTLGSGTGSGTINTSTGLVTATGSGTLTIIATLLGNGNYNQSITSTVIVIGKSTPTLVFNPLPSGMVVGLTQTVSATSTTSLVDNGGGISYTLGSGTGSGTINTSTGLVTATGSGTLTIIATLLGNGNYNQSITSTVIVIGKSTPSMVFSPLPSGMVVGSTQTVSATSTTGLVDNGGGISYTLGSGTGSGTINTSTGLVTATGSGTLTIIATLLGNGNYNQSITSTVIVIGKSTPTLVFSPLPSGMLVGLTQTVSATSTTSLVDSGGGISYTLGSGTGSGTINSSTGLVTAMGSGTLTIVATLLGNTNYNQSITSTVIVIGKSTPTLVFNPLPSGMVVGLTQTVSATSTTSLVDNGGGISYTLGSGTGSGTINSSTGLLTAKGSGTLTIIATLLGNGNYNQSITSTVIVIGKSTPSLFFNSLASTMALNGTQTVSATSTTGLVDNGGGISYTLLGGGSGTALINALTGFMTATGAGTVTVQATLLGNGNYNGSSTSTVITISVGVQTLSLQSSSGSFSLTVGSSIGITTTSTAGTQGGTIGYGAVGIGSGSLTVNPLTGFSTVLSGVSVGQVTLTASTLGNGNYNPAITSTAINVGIGSQSITMNALPSVSVGTSIGISTTRSVSSALGGNLSYTLLSGGSGSATIDVSSGTLTGTRVGSVIIQVMALGNTNYYAASSVTQTISITLGTQTLSINNQPINIVVGSSLSITTTRSVSSSLGGGLTYTLVSGSGSASIDVNGNLTGVHVGTVSLTVIGLGNTNYYGPVSSSVLVQIGQGTQTLQVSSNGTMAINSSLTASVVRTNINGSLLSPGRGGSLSYSISSGGGSATVDGNGFIHAISTGFVTLQVIAFGDTDYYVSQTSQSIAIFYAPGGVGVGSVDLKLWLRADNGVIPDVSGNVSEWDDQSQSITMTLNQAQPSVVSGSISVVDSGLNYNRMLSFSGGQGLSGVGDFSFGTSNTIIAVGSSAGSSGAMIFGTSNTTAGPGLTYRSSAPLGYGLNSVSGPGSAGVDLSTARILIGNYSSGTSNVGVLYNNGVLLNSSPSTGGITSSNVFTFGLGGGGYGGTISELIYLNRNLSVNERTRAESYLAVKYGISLDPVSEPNYLASDGTVIWGGISNTSYTNTVIGIGFDTSSGLNQKQTSSASGGDVLSLGLGTIASTNALNGFNFSVDRSFLMVGNNGISSVGSVSSGAATTSDIPIGGTPKPIRMRMSRVWQAQNTGGVGSVQLQFDLTGAFSSTVPYQVSELCLLIDKNHNNSFADETVSGGGVTTTAVLVGGNVYAFSGISLSTGDRFTVGLMKKDQFLAFGESNNPMVVGQSLTLTASVFSLTGSASVSYGISSTSGGGSATIDATTGLVTAIGTGSVTIKASSLANADYISALTSSIVTIGKSTPSLSFTNTLTATTVGGSIVITAVSTSPGSLASTGGISYSLLGSGSTSATLDSSGGTLTGTQSGEVVVQVSQASDVNYNSPLPISLTITINKGTPTLSITSTTLSMAVGSTATVSSVSTPPLVGGVPSTGGITYSIISGISNALIDALTGEITAIASGIIVVQAMQGGDVNYNAPVPVSLTITIGVGVQSLSLSSSTGNYSMTVGSSLTATASSNVIGGGAITYSISSGSGSATVDLNTGFIRAIGSGTVTLRAATLGNSNYTSAVINQTITIGKGTPSLSFTNTLTSTTVGGSIVITGLSTSPGILASTGGISYSLLGSGSTSASIDSSSGVLTGIRSGQVVVQVSQGSDSNYNSPVPISITITINKSTPSLSFTNTLTATTVGGSIVITGLSTSPGILASTGGISYSLLGSGSTSATLDASGGTLTGTRSGEVVVQVSQASDVNYNSALPISITITIGKGTPTLSITSTTLSMAVGSTATVSALSVPPLVGGVPSTGGITYSIISGISNALIDALTGQITAMASGSIVVQAIQGGDVNYNTPVPISLTITIGAGVQSLSLSSSTGNYSMTVGGSLTVTASSNVIGGGAITYSLSSGSGSATVDLNTGFITAIGSGTVTLVAATSGNVNYTPAMISQTITIGKGTPSLSFSNTLTSTTVGGSIVITGLSTAPGSLASTGGISYSLLGSGSTSATLDASGGTLTGTRSGQVVVQVSQGSDANYNSPVPISITITINKGTPTLSITSTTLSMVVGNTATVSAVSILPLVGGISSTGSITYSIVSGSGSATLSAVTGQLTATGSGIIVVQAMQGGDVNYNAPVPVSLTITIGAGVQSLSLSSSTGNYSMTVGSSLTATASSNVIGGGAITYSISSGSGSATVDVNSGFVTAIGAGTVTLRAATLGNSNYTSAVINQTITIGKGTPSLSFTNTLTSTTVGGSIVITGLSTSPGILASTGGISYSLLGSGSTSASIDSSSGVLTGIRSGQVVVQVSQGSDSNYNSPVPISITITINKSTPSLSFTNTLTATTVGGSIVITGLSTSPGILASTGGISYSLLGSGSTSATLDASGGTLTGTRSGQVVVQVSQGSDANYNSPVPISITITIGKGTPTLSITSTTLSMAVGSTATVSALSVPPLVGGVSSTGGITYSIISGSGSATINGSTGMITAIGSGSIVVQAMQGGDVNYNAPVPVNLTITIGAGLQSLSLSSSTGSYVTVVDGSLTVTAMSNVGSSGGSITYSLSSGSGSATINANTGFVQAFNAGTVLVTAYISGNVNYTAASISQVLTINKGSQTLTISPATNTMLAGTTLQLSTTTTAGIRGGLVSYGITSIGSGSATVNGLGLVSALSAGTVTLIVNISGDSDYNGSSLSQIITIIRGGQTLTIVSTNETFVGGSLTASATSTATVSSGGQIVYSLLGGSGSATINPITGLLIGYQAGLVTLQASTVGDANYNGATLSQTITIGKGTPTLSLTSTATTMNVGTTMPVYGSSQGPLGGITPSSALVYSLLSGGSNATISSQGLIRAYGSGTIVVKVSQGGDANYYAPLPATLTIMINAGSQTLRINSIDMMSLSSIIAATATTTAGSGHGGVISFTLTPITGIATIDANNNITASQEGQVLLTAMISGDSSYLPASVSQTITIVSLRMQAASSNVLEGSNTVMSLSLVPTGIILPRDVVFDLSGSLANPEHYHLPPSVTLVGGQTSVNFELEALSDTILFDSEPLVVMASNVYLNTVSSTLMLLDTTAQNSGNLVITIGNGTIFQDGTAEIGVSLPLGVSVAHAVTVSLSIGSSSDLSLLGGPPVIDPIVVIPAGSGRGSFSITASSSSDVPTHIQVEGSSVSFTVNPGVITVLNRKIDIIIGVSDNGDGINDCLTVSNIEKYPDNRLDIVNRQGVTVFSIAHYNNADVSFCGMSNADGPSPYHLTDGTYYYVLTLIDKTKDKENTKEEKYYKFFEERGPQ